MMLPLPVILLGSHLILAADQVPTFDLGPTCRSAGENAVGPNRDPDACKRDEMDAYDKLVSEWGQFSTSERAHCVQMSGAGGSPSYVELLTCMELAKSAAALPPGDKLEGMKPSEKIERGKKR
jgi:hypothetical protein